MKLEYQKGQTLSSVSARTKGTVRNRHCHIHSHCAQCSTELMMHYKSLAIKVTSHTSRNYRYIT